MENLKLGPLEGYSALIVIIVLVLALAALVAVLVVSIIKALKERKDQKEDKAENEFYSEYGVNAEEMRLNQKLARLRGEVRDAMRGKKRAKTEETAQEGSPAAPVEEVKEQEPVEEEKPVAEPIAQEPAPIEEVKEESAPEPVQEPAPEPIPEPVPEPVAEPVQEPAPEPTPEPVVEEEPKKQGVAQPAAKKVVKKKPDDWSKYDGTYEGYYYDPEDACYYEGTPSPALAKKLAAKEAELEALNANKDKKVIIKKVAPPFAALKTPKNARKEPQKIAGFDESVIYGKYIIEHVDKEDGTQEYFYTLYDASGNDIYESSNYTTKEYCERAINRFKSHALIGTFTIEAADGKFFFVLKRKTYVHKGAPQNTFEDANARMKEIKSYAQTDIIREQ